MSGTKQHRGGVVSGSVGLRPQTSWWRFGKVVRHFARWFSEASEPSQESAGLSLRLKRTKNITKQTNEYLRLVCIVLFVLAPVFYPSSTAYCVIDLCGCEYGFIQEGSAASC